MTEQPPSVAKQFLKKAAAGAILFALGVLATLLVQNARQPAPPKTISAPTTNALSINSTTNSLKPWGLVEYRKISLEDSEQIFLDRAERLKKSKWFFENHSPAQVTALFQTAGLNDSQKKELLNTNHWEVYANGCAVSPSEDLILQLSHEARQKIYSVLARCGGNYNQTYPFRFPDGTFDERFAGSGLSIDKINFVRELGFINDGLFSFCDVESVRLHLTTNEFTQLIETLYSTPAVWMRLRVQPDSDIHALLSYWGKGEQAKRIKPLLESLQKIPGGTALNISYLMPAFARLRLYTFPDPTVDPIVAKEDCFYTSLNFFNEQPDARFLDTKNNRQTLQTEYFLTQDNPTFGDLVTLINQRGDAVHICVYIADDVVFTKNGANYLQPWVLMKIPDMLAFFPSEQPLRTVIFRRKDLAVLPTALKVSSDR